MLTLAHVLTLGALLFWHLRPRPARPRELAVPVDEQEAPALHALAAAAADAVGCPPPRRVLIDTTYPVGVLPVGYAGRTDLVVGLPQWTVLRPQERVSAVAAAHDSSESAVVAFPAGRVDGLPFGAMLTGPAFADAGLAGIAERIAVGMGEATDVADRYDEGHDPCEVDVFVVGAHRAGQVLNHELTERGGVLVETVRTASAFAALRSAYNTSYSIDLPKRAT